jgi:predicted SAM-dependent methyltransferase
MHAPRRHKHVAQVEMDVMSASDIKAGTATSGRSGLRGFLDNLRETQPGLFNALRGSVYALMGAVSHLRATLRLGRQFRTYAARHAVRKLHIGCGGNLITGWFNTDRGALRADIAYLDATARFPFPDTSFDYIFTEHMIEHIPFRAGLRFVGECFRVLNPGGKLRVTTPDLERIVGLLRHDTSPLEREFVAHVLEELPGTVGRHPAYVVNHYVRAWGHTFIYDKDVLSDVFRYCGFTDVRAFSPGESDDPALQDLERHGSIYPNPDYNLVESMVIQGTKPV